MQFNRSRIISTRPDGNIIISNLHDIGRNELVKNETLPVEPDFLFPLLRGRDVGQWRAKPEHCILVPQDPDQPSKAYPLKDLQTKLPLTNAFLQRFEKQLRSRSGFRQYFNPKLDPFYAMYNVGPYTFSPFKVVWREQASFLTAAVVEAENDLGKPVVPDHKLMLCPCDSAKEAHYVCAFLNSTLAQFIVKSYALETSVSTHVLNYVRIPKFDAKNKLHVRLAEKSVACHAAAPSANDTDLAKLEKTVNETAAAIWDVSDVELRDIESSLADLQ